MKVLILANYDVGLYRFRRELIQALLGRNDVLIALPEGNLVHPLEEMGCHFVDTPIDRRGLNPVKDLKLFFHFLKLLWRGKPDLVITYTIKPNVYGGLACRILGVPYAINVTGLGSVFQTKGFVREVARFLYRLATKKAKVVFFENTDNMELFQKEKIISANQGRVLSGAGVNLEYFSYAPYPSTEETKFVFSGRVMKEKGVEELFSAMERLRAEGENCTLDILGGYEEDYADTIRSYEEAGWLKYHGYVEDVRPYIEKTHCVVLASYHEGMANTNLEGAAMGRPIITSNIPGCREAVLDGESGLLCKPQDADSLYETMKRFVSLPADIREQMGKAGRAHMEAMFDKKKVVEETMEGLGF